MRNESMPLTRLLGGLNLNSGQDPAEGKQLALLHTQGTMQRERRLLGGTLPKLGCCSVKSQCLSFVGHFEVCALRGHALILCHNGGGCRPVPACTGLLTPPLKPSVVPPFSPSRSSGQESALRPQHPSLQGYSGQGPQWPCRRTYPPTPGWSGWGQDVFIARGSPVIPSYQRIPSPHAFISFYVSHPVEQEASRDRRNGFPLNTAFCTLPHAPFGASVEAQT